MVDYSSSLLFYFSFELKRATSCESFPSFLADLMPVPNRQLGRSCERSGIAVVSSTRTHVMQFGIQPLLLLQKWMAKVAKAFSFTLLVGGSDPLKNTEMGGVG